MGNASQAQATAPQRQPPKRRRSRDARNQLPDESLSLEQTLRVMDVARELRDGRETAEEMFRRDDLRRQLRDKLVRTARMSGDNVTEAEIETAIQQYFETVHTYHDPKPGMKRWLAHAWVWRGRIMAGATAIAAVAGSFWFMFA